MDNDILSLKGRIALVTGAGQGVGRQVALHFAAAGAEVVIVNDYFAERAQSVVKEIEALGGKALAAPGDVTKFDEVSRWLPEAIAAAGGLDILVNNAGNAGPTDDLTSQPVFWETGPEQWDNWLGTNLFGVMYMCRIAVPEIIKRGNGGSIVNIISDAGRVGEPRLVVYSGAKAGAAGFSRALAKELGRYSIRVNCVALGSVRTPGISALISDPEVVKKVVRVYPLKRLGEPSDAANAVLFLASDASSWITAQTYPVNGGYAVSQ
jgi:3-oxoacyl-[acyl-carrier protein] reductase